jgi:ribose/xylose/arabinose/galactoside ABC-type transport system permease subunit
MRSPRWCSAAPACRAAAGWVCGTLIGALIIGVLNNSLNLQGVSSFYQLVAKGVIILLAVFVDQWLRQRLAIQI